MAEPLERRIRALEREAWRLRVLYGVSIIIMALVLMAVMPSFIRENFFRTPIPPSHVSTSSTP